MSNCATLKEIQRIKKECSLHRLSMTAEEQAQYDSELIKWTAVRLDKPIKVVKASSEIFNSRLP